MTLTPDILQKLLRYEPETGRLFWRQRHPEMFRSRAAADAWNARYAERPVAKHTDFYGYRRILIKKRTYLEHRVIWAIVHGVLPHGEIDHINGDKLDNRLSNLRDVSRSENQRNQTRPKNNTTGHIGVVKVGAAYQAYIRVGGKKRHLGTWPTIEKAVSARNAAQQQLGFHPNHGRS